MRENRVVAGRFACPAAAAYFHAKSLYTSSGLVDGSDPS